jgi:hypothetical protein
MRSFLAIAGVLALTAGCRSQDVFLTPTTVLLARTSGVELHDQKRAAHVGMMSTTCSFDPVEGRILGDFNLVEEEGDEQVLDLRGHIVLADTLEGLQLLDLNSRETTALQGEGTAMDGVLTDKGPIVMHGNPDGGCTLGWHDLDVWLPLGACSTASVEAPNTGNQAFVLVDDTLFLAWPDGSVVELGLAERVRWLERHHLAVSLDGTTATAWDGKGKVRWTRELRGRTDDVTTLPGHLLGVTAAGEGLVALDARDGSTWGSTDDILPGPMISNEEGTLIGFIMEDRVGFFEVNTGSLPPEDHAQAVDVGAEPVLD